MDCNHTKTEQGLIRTLHLNEEFTFNGHICSECGAEQWTPEVIAQYESWKKKIEKKHEDRMRVQNIALTKAAKGFIEEQCLIFNVDESKVIRAIVATYFEVVENLGIGKELLAKASIEDPSETIKAVRFTSSLYNNVKSWSAIFDIGMGRYVGEIINRMVYVISQSKNVESTYRASVAA